LPDGFRYHDRALCKLHGQFSTASLGYDYSFRYVFSDRHLATDLTISGRLSGQGNARLIVFIAICPRF
jgi:hypothetical protein